MRFRVPHLKPNEVPVTEERQTQTDAEGLQYEDDRKGAPTANATDDDGSEIVNSKFQHGVQSAQAMTQVWSMSHLIAAYIM